MPTTSPNKQNKMPSLFHLVWQPRKQHAQQRAKATARRLSLTRSTTPDHTPSRSDTVKSAPARPSSDPGHHHVQLNRAQQKTLKRQHKANDSLASSLSGSKTTPHHNDAFGHGPEHHKGLPIVALDARFGYLEHSGRELHQSKELTREPLLSIDESRIGERVYFWARIHGTRALSSKLAFVLFRDGLQIIQGVIRVGAVSRPTSISPTPRSSTPVSSSHQFHPSTTTPDGEIVEVHHGVTEEMVRWAEKLPLETLVLVEGLVQSPQEDSHGEQNTVRNANVHGAEIEVTRLLVLSQVTQRTPFAVAQAAQPPPSQVPAAGEADSAKTATSSIPRVGFHAQLEHRALALRTPHSHAIFRLVAAFSRAARSYLDQRDFTEIHSAKLQQGATESGASVFNVDYFGRSATLAQSPQLAKEMSIGADFGRVYEIGPVFRAEQSNTHRHLTEFTGLDVEMAIDLDYHEAMHTIDSMLKHIFRTVQAQNRAEIEAVKNQFPHEDLVFPEKTVILTFSQGIRLLRQSGWREEGETDQDAQKELEDLSTRAEVRLGQLVKEKYNTDYYILDKFPAAVRPFYTMPDAENPKYSNSFDIFVRGEEILSGGQRLHNATALEAALEARGIDPNSMREYLEAFQFAMPPHAGGGIGLERLVMLFLKLGNIRHSTLIPRDPRSFPQDPKAVLLPKDVHLPVPSGVVGWDEPNVLSKDPMYNEGEHPKLEDLIVKYGDSTNTAWTDKEYEIWRHEPTGAAIGFVEAKGHAVTWGAPLAPPEQLAPVIRAYIQWAKDVRKLGIVWSNADDRTEQILVKQHQWRALAVTSEQRVDPRLVETPSDKHKHVDKKVRQARSAGVTVGMVEGTITEALRAELDEGMHQWMQGRSGAQIHTTNLRPWSDVEHRTYFVARDKDKKAVGVIVLHKLAPEHGFQIKWSLMFPSAPNGTSELLVTTAMRTLARAGVTTATFGAGAKDTFEAVNGIGSIRARILGDVYKGISKTFGLTRKSHFREQFGSKEDSLFICYPPHGLGFSGINAIMDSVKSH